MAMSRSRGCCKRTMRVFVSIEGRREQKHTRSGRRQRAHMTRGTKSSGSERLTRCSSSVELVRYDGDRVVGVHADWADARMYGAQRFDARAGGLVEPEVIADV